VRAEMVEALRHYLLLLPCFHETVKQPQNEHRLQSALLPVTNKINTPQCTMQMYSMQNSLLLLRHMIH